MFTGIVKNLGTVKQVQKNESNLDITLFSPISKTLKIDQSIAHNGICLTVTAIDKTAQTYQVTAVAETIAKTNILYWQENTIVNLEKSLSVSGLIDGHIVQGHIDTAAICKKIMNENGSYKITFKFHPKYKNLIVEKGSVAVNGVSLTALDVKNNKFSVAIIPYTFEHTNFNKLAVNDVVNIEWDILGKYVQRGLKNYKKDKKK